MNRRTTTLSASVALAAALALTGCSSSSDSSDGSADGKPKLEVSGAYMPQPVMDMAGGFLTIKNAGGAADKLTSVTSPSRTTSRSTRRRTRRC